MQFCLNYVNAFHAYMHFLKTAELTEYGNLGLPSISIIISGGKYINPKCCIS